MDNYLANSSEIPIHSNRHNVVTGIILKSSQVDILRLIGQQNKLLYCKKEGNSHGLKCPEGGLLM